MKILILGAGKMGSFFVDLLSFIRLSPVPVVLNCERIFRRVPPFFYDVALDVISA
jgi:hypothetical protein